MEENRQLFNFEETLERFGGDKELLVELTDMFVNQNSFESDILQKMIAQGDFIQGASYVHKLKGSCGTLGCEVLYDQCVKLENILKGKTTGDVQQEADSLCEIYESTVAELRTWLENKQ